MTKTLEELIEIRKNAAIKRKATIEKKRLDKKTKKDVSHIIDKKNKTAYHKLLKTLDFGHAKINIKKSGARYKGKDVIQVIVRQKGMDRQIIIDHVNKVSHLLGKHDLNKGLIDLSVLGDKWYYQGQTTFGNNVVFKDEYDDLFDDSYDMFALYLSALPETFMGHSENNDCLYNCLKQVLGNHLLKIFPEPVDFKKFLKLPKYAKIDLKYMDQIEKRLNVSINFSGDDQYTSKLNSLKVINLKIINEHCLLDEKMKKKDIFNLGVKISNRDRIPLLFNIQTLNAYDHIDDREFHFTKEARNKVFHWQTDFILINKFDEKESLKDNYNRFTKMADALKKETNSKINLYRTGNYVRTALNLFNEMTQHIPIPDPIKQREGLFIDNASQGAIIFNTKGYEGPCWKCDVKSMYPSIMKSSQQCFPVKEGELKYITEFEQFFRFGIYRAKITGNICKKLFRLSYNHHYTHIDLTRAKELGYQIDLIIDDKPNFLYYSRDKCLTGSEIFSEFIDYLFKLKENKVLGAKNILNTLWGAISEKDKKKKKINPSVDDVFEVPDDCKPTFKPFDDNNTIIKYCYYDKIYKYGWARIMPFILAKGRSMISKIIEPYHDIAIRCHTDGVLFKEEPKGLKYDDKMGSFVFEGHFENITINKSGIIKY